MPEIRNPVHQGEDEEVVEGCVEASQTEVGGHLHVVHHSEDHLQEVLLNGVHPAGQEMVLLHHAVEIPCLLQTEGPHEDPLSQGEGPLPLTDTMIMDLLTVGTPQGIMTVEATVIVKGRGHQAMAMIIMAAGILLQSVVAVVV